MPFYDYRCDKCDKVFEIFHSMNDESNQLCPTCGNKLDKQISVPMIVTKTLRTIGAIAERNTNEALKQGKVPPGWEKKDTPWYRSQDKINPDILKNPQKYIEEGKI